MTITYNIKNLTATLENLNMTGTFAPANTTLDTSIPPASIGLYQLINKLISELVSIKNTVTVEEKRIMAVLAADAHANAFTGAIAATASGAGLKVANREAATAGTAGRNEMTITVDDEFNKPAVFIASTAGDISEDGLFEFLQKILHAIFKITNNSVTADTGCVVADPIDVAIYSGNAA